MIRDGYIYTDPSGTAEVSACVFIEALELFPGPLRALLDAAMPALGAAFGLAHLELFVRGPVADLWGCQVLLPEGYAGDPEAALAAFDETWWIAHMPEEGGLFVIDYVRKTATLMDTA